MRTDPAKKLKEAKECLAVENGKATAYKNDYKLTKFFTLLRASRFTQHNAPADGHRPQLSGNIS
jgi:hypothetical protein